MDLLVVLITHGGKDIPGAPVASCKRENRMIKLQIRKLLHSGILRYTGIPVHLM